MSISSSGLFNDTKLYEGSTELENLVQSSFRHSFLVGVIAHQVVLRHLQKIVPMLLLLVHHVH